MLAKDGLDDGIKDEAHLHYATLFFPNYEICTNIQSENHFQFDLPSNLID